MRALLFFALAACGGNATTGSPTTQAGAPGSPTTQAGAPGTPDKPAPAGCDSAVPDRACQPNVALRVCKDGDKDRVGEWRYAIAAPPYSTVEDITSDELAKRWKGTGLTATADAIEALAGVLGPAGEVTKYDADKRPDVTDKQWAVVAADELLPNWKLVTVDGKHPLDKAPGPLAVPLCSTNKVTIRNIEPDKLTVLVMTGTTALTRFTSKLMEDKGVLYPLPAVEPWLKAADFVHISNEVSFIPKCDTGDGKPTMSFCSKENYIELLEKSHAKIIELTGSHLHDYGHDWTRHTIEMYEKRGWIFFGGGRNQLEATAPRLLEHNGNKLAFLGCNAPMTEWKVIRNGAGVAACDWPRMQWQIRDLRANGYTPIVSIQHDEVYKHDPPHGLVRDLRAIADAGAAFVMGSQAHCPHPWEVHRGAYIHYGPGNFYFDQFWHPVRDAAQDKLYIHKGKLLTVGHLYTRTEERGRPRVLDGKDRSELLVDLSHAQARLPPGAKPWDGPVEAPATIERPDSVLIKGVVQPFTVRPPAKLAPDKKYPLVVQLGGKADVGDDMFVVTPGKTTAPAKELGAAITAWMTAKYPVDPDKITLATRAPAKPKAKKP